MSHFHPALAASPASSAFPPPGVTNRRRWTIVGLLFVASLINYFDRATISFALPLISRELSLGPEAKGLLLSAFFWSYALMQIPIGWCADRLDLRWVYAGAFALWSLAQGLTGLAGSLAVLVAFRVVLGVGESIYLPGGTKIVSLLFAPKERGLPSGLFDFGTRTGLVLEGVLIPWMLVHLGWRKTFMMVGFTALLWLVPWLLALPKNLNPSSRQLGTGESEPKSSSLQQFLAALVFSALLLLAPLWIVLARLLAPRPGDARRPGAAGTFLRLFWLLRNRNLLGICLGFFCFDYYWYLLLTWLPDYLVEVRHLSILRAGLYAALPYLVFGACEPIGGWLADRLIARGWDETRTRKGIVTLAFLMGLLLIPAARVESAESALALIMGASLVGLATGNLLVILQCCAPHNQVGVWTGFENYAGNIGGIVAPILTGVLVARTGGFGAAFVVGPAVLITGLMAYWFIVGKLEPPARA
jgi:ACS family D-galactonate transporter-like MFS transporter